MINTREAVYGAMLNFLKTSVGFALVSRIPIPEQDLSMGNLPALEQLASSEEGGMKGYNLPTKWTIRQALMVYASVDPLGNGDTPLNNLLDAIETALKPSPVTGYQTLGGLVTSCKFVGVISKDPGYQTGIGAAAIGIEMVITS
jgi:hypothetical protein